MNGEHLGVFNSKENIQPTVRGGYTCLFSINREERGCLGGREKEEAG